MTMIQLKIVGYYSTITNKVHKNKSSKTRAENKQKKEVFNNKVQKLINKFKK